MYFTELSAVFPPETGDMCHLKQAENARKHDSK